ncbi:hypothetical protein [Hymenobacter nivis]|uniref:hypothetical protein n=1 Tax=Hymenobacter nivis TaxID=1850093 RepID=UPI001877BD6F|nr:hypothetical protein [Hymenobacter nivis]
MLAFDEQFHGGRDAAQLQPQAATESCIISTGMFVSYLLEPKFGVVDITKSEMQALGSLDTAVTLTTPDNVGLLTAETMFAETTIKNEVVLLGGDAVTYGEVADKLAAALHRPFGRLEWTVPLLMEDLVRDPQNMMRKYRAAFAQGRGVAWPKDGTFNQRHALLVTDVAAWMDANLGLG